MEKLAKQISYLRGLADGMEVSEASREGKILTGMIQLLDDVYGELRELHARVEENEEYAEAIDKDLEDLELYTYGDVDNLYETVGNCAEEHDTQDRYQGFSDLDDDEGAYLYENVQPSRQEQLEPINAT
jgi:hypothetical protein